jgi:methionyl-tRNA formyltransferase
MKLVFMGSPEFAVPCLEGLHAAGHELALVVSQPDRPAGRGRRLAPTAVKATAEALGLPVLTQDRGKAERVRITAAVREAAPDAVIVVAFGHILRASLLEAAPLGCLNVHFSLLPRWRGVSPVQHAILHGDQWSGVTLMRMDAGVDTGPVLAVAPTPIGPRETGGDLLERLGHLGAELLVDRLPAVADGRLAGTAQTDTGAVYAPKLGKGLSPVRWDRDAVTVHNQIRALDPFPGTTSFLQDKLLKIGRAEPVALHDAHAAPGTVLAVDAGGLEVACGQGRIRILQLQAPGKRMLPVDEFLRGFPVAAGQVFSS